MQLPVLEWPFDIIGCSWPYPVQQSDGNWISDPVWDLPNTIHFPKPRWIKLHNESCWTIDWQDQFRKPLWLKDGQDGRWAGQMRGFHIVFRIRVNATGRLVFWDTDGCIIRRNNRIVHCDRASHCLTQHELDVLAGDRLEIAHWQRSGHWTWGARLIPATDGLEVVSRMLMPYLTRIHDRLRVPNGPPLKCYFSGKHPIRTIVGVYSMILNGYRPREVILYGEYQWALETRDLFSQFLPFARVVPTQEVLSGVQRLGKPRLVDLARRYWFVMKTCVGLLCPPSEYCMMDDDIFILNPVDEALESFKNHNLVYAPDWDHSAPYLEAWGSIFGNQALPLTGRLNTGLYWMRNTLDPCSIASLLMRLRMNQVPGWIWEQGFMANQFAREQAVALPSERYFYPIFDGMPGGVLEYDYPSNPSGFVTIHFGGIGSKPKDAVALVLARDILDRSRVGTQVGVGSNSTPTFPGQA